MEIDIFGILYVIWQNLVQFFSNSLLIATVKFFLFVYVVVLLIDIILLLVFRGVAVDLQKAFFGTYRPLIRPSAAFNRFEKILARLKGNNPSQYKAAILEADAFADEVLAGIGHSGETMKEKLESIQDGQLETKHLLVEAHQIRNRIVHEADFVVSREEAERLIANYRAFFAEVELF